MPAKIKICGISTPEALDATIAARADYAGLVFYPASPRAVTSNVAGALTSRAAGQIAMVGLFVDADDAVIADALVAAKLNALQLHGSESPERVAQLRARFGKPVWKALPVASASDVARAAAYAGAADLILFDAKTPKGALPGGMGLAFDWSLLAGYRGALPWGLAGGLNPTNVAEAIARTGARWSIPPAASKARRASRIPTRLPISPLRCAWPKSRRSIGVVQRKDRLAGAPLPSGEVGKI
ncbi:phosphoribosylanthranilate isomerase [Escherichia coli]|uniref:phosphoribosylanthranilate isomerase n=1 Tax=Escherichia coli TaxID=562 RepID=UPI001D18AE7D|nr:MULTISPECIES: phosphoribosylanthranilate isomerase [Gammaproteobacteria]MCX8271147.1 phosphoribosylanthranilate isomerase [Escherichia coli]